MIRLCEAVDFAHRHLVVHRDLKPSNVLVTPESELKLLDFGLAKILAPDEDPGLTRTEIRVLTPAYAAPEQVFGEPVTTATDVFSLGVLLYETLTGELPFERSATSTARLSAQVSSEEIERPSSRLRRMKRDRGSLAKWERRVAGDLDTIVIAALRREPERRYRSAAAMADDPSLAESLANRGTFALVRGRFAEGLVDLDAARRILVAAGQSSSRLGAEIATSRTNALLQAGRPQEALEEAELAWELHREHTGPDHHETWMQLSNVAMIEMRPDRTAAAAHNFARVVEGIARSADDQHALLVYPLRGLGRAQEALGDAAAAEASHRRAASIALARLGASHASTSRQDLEACRSRSSFRVRRGIGLPSNLALAEGATRGCLRNGAHASRDSW